MIVKCYCFLYYALYRYEKMVNLIGLKVAADIDSSYTKHG